MSLLMDLDILPTLPGSSKSNQSGRKCIPGDKLFATSEGQYRAGNGCYEFHGQIFASLAGYVYVFSKEEEGDSNHVLPTQGSIVTARVESITLKFAKCSIICVGDTLLGHEFNSTLRKEDVRDREKDKVEIYKFVQPGDIILARVLGYGDSQTFLGVFLSIAEEELGAISGRGQNGERLVPLTATVMKSISSEYRENRKVAMVPVNAHSHHFWTPPPPPPRPPPPPANNTSWFTSPEIVPSCSWNTSFSSQNTSNHAPSNSVSTSSSYPPTNSIHFLDSVNQQPFTPSVHYNTIYDNITSNRDRIDLDQKITNYPESVEAIYTSHPKSILTWLAARRIRICANSHPILRRLYLQRPSQGLFTMNWHAKRKNYRKKSNNDDGESDGEYPEMGRNWRCRSLFNARITHEALPSVVVAHKKRMTETEFPIYTNDFYEFDENGGEIESASKPMPSISSSHGYVLLMATHGILMRSPLRRLQMYQKPRNNSLRIVNGKRIYAGMKDCFQFTPEKPVCRAYSVSSSTMVARITSPLMFVPGYCEVNAVKALLPRWRPFCSVETPFGSMCRVQSRHLSSGVMCDIGPHRYYYSTIKEKSKSVDTISHSKSTSCLSEADPSASNKPKWTTQHSAGSMNAGRTRRSAAIRGKNAWSSLLPQKKGSGVSSDVESETVDEPAVKKETPKKTQIPVETVSLYKRTRQQSESQKRARVSGKKPRLSKAEKVNSQAEMSPQSHPVSPTKLPVVVPAAPASPATKKESAPAVVQPKASSPAKLDPLQQQLLPSQCSQTALPHSTAYSMNAGSAAALNKEQLQEIEREVDKHLDGEFDGNDEEEFEQDEGTTNLCSTTLTTRTST
uniref:Uncharacterized protein n=1 Tax=Ditylenchus dipsaci TaxID=166011 RepID=A0A915EDZ3_9BILA